MQCKLTVARIGVQLPRITLVRGRTKILCTSRWHDYLKQGIDRATGCYDRRTPDKDDELKDSVQLHGGKWFRVERQISVGADEIRL
jgi:hypothetical protein